MRLIGKVALVTGASRGIGKAIAIALAQEGAFIAVNYANNVDAAMEVVEAVRSVGSDAIPVKADVSDSVSIEKMVAEITELKAVIDVLVNNAGIWRGGRLQQMRPDEVDKVIDTNLKGMLNCTRTVLPSMLNQGAGKIINISSVIGIVGHPGDTVYGASKAGIFGFTKSLAREVAQQGINVNAVAPGIISTDMNQSLDEKTRKRLEKRIPKGFIGKPEDIAEVVCFLASGASYVTGQVWTVDGGYTLMC
jgi:3-oxoacyl-[acyl-carrier protein] reductase